MSNMTKEKYDQLLDELQTAAVNIAMKAESSVVLMCLLSDVISKMSISLVGLIKDEVIAEYASPEEFFNAEKTTLIEEVLKNSLSNVTEISYENLKDSYQDKVISEFLAAKKRIKNGGNDE